MENISPRLTKPFKTANILDISQSFHSEHKAIDWIKGYGAPVVAPEDVEITAEICDCAISDGPKGIERGFGLRMTGLETNYRYNYWHLWPHTPVSVGDVVKRGKIIGFMGNSGHVLSGGVYVPLGERNTPPYKGTHLHQVVYNIHKIPVDPLPLIDLWIEPEYSTAELIAAWSKTLMKVGKSYFR